MSCNEKRDLFFQFHREGLNNCIYKEKGNEVVESGIGKTLDKAFYRKDGKANRAFVKIEKKTDTDKEIL